MGDNLLSDSRKSQMMNWMTENLSELRTKAGMTQEELAVMTGISRQRYSAIENRKEEMTWSVFLSLLFVFENSEGSRKVIDKNRQEVADVFIAMNRPVVGDEPAITNLERDIFSKLDEQAKTNLINLLKIEQARCEAESKKDTI